MRLKGRRLVNEAINRPELALTVYALNCVVKLQSWREIGGETHLHDLLLPQRTKILFRTANHKIPGTRIRQRIA